MQATISAQSGGQATCVREKTNWALIIIRILTAFAGLMIFFPEEIGRASCRERV